MAYKNIVLKPPKYPNQDTVKTAQFYRGFSSVNNTASVNLYDQELVKQDLINHFNIKKGEKLMDPNFGTIIWDLLYDPLTTELKEAIKEDIREILSNDPRIQPLEVNVTEEQFGILLEITMSYTASDQTEQLRLSFDKELGSVSL
jgi:phage baseplate assembly protein W